MTFVRYIAVQWVAYGIDMGTFLVILKIGVFDAVFANVIAKLAAGGFAFVAHRHFTFRAAEGMTARGQAIKYFVLLALNIPVASATLALLLMWLSFPVVAKFVADVICVGLTYLLSKLFVFTVRKKNSTGVGA